MGVDRRVRAWLRAALAAVVLASGPALATDPDLAPFSELQNLGLGFQELGGHLPPPGAFGGQNEATITQNGASLSATVAQYGGRNEASVTQSGFANVAALLQVGNGLNVSVTQNGNNMTARVVQRN